MGKLPWLTIFRGWFALDVLLPILWWVLGEKPLFCDFAREGCPLDDVREER